MLLACSKLCKEQAKTARLVLAAFIGGAYSLVLLFDKLAFAVSLLGKVSAACVIVFAAFGKRPFWLFIKNVAVFMFVNFVFLGVIIGGWMIFKPTGVVINNSTVYFDVSVKILLASAAAAYAATVLIIRLYNRRISKTSSMIFPWKNAAKNIAFSLLRTAVIILKSPLPIHP